MHSSRSKIPSKKSPYIYEVTFLALLGAPYIYDISRLRVKNYQNVNPRALCAHSVRAVRAQLAVWTVADSGIVAGPVCVIFVVIASFIELGPGV
jgi:hypothetical protein